MADLLVNQLNEQKRKVAFDTYDITVQQLISMVYNDQIDIAPEYQRQYRWDIQRQSQFIESLFLGIPIPSLFMATNKDGTWELVDGVQRLSTLIHFAGDINARKKLNLSTALTLNNLEKLDYFNGYRFDRLPSSVQLQFNLRPIKVTTLNDKSDKVVRFDLFERLNTGGVVLSNQEIRACVFRGKFNDLLEELAQDPDFTTVVKLSKREEQDRTREEYVLRFFAFYHRYKDFEHSVIEFLNSYMEEQQKSVKYPEFRNLFRKTFSQLAQLFPNGLVRKQNNTPVNLYEGVAVGAALALKRVPRLRRSGLDTWLNSKELTKFTTAATNTPTQVSGRIEYCEAKFAGL